MSTSARQMANDERRPTSHTADPHKHDLIDVSFSRPFKLERYLHVTRQLDSSLAYWSLSKVEHPLSWLLALGGN